MPIYWRRVFLHAMIDEPEPTTQNKWDCPIDFDELWKQYNRVVKPNGAIVLTAQSPFDKRLA